MGYGKKWKWAKWGPMTRWTRNGYSGLNCPQCGCKSYG